jgi:hypothetical protein
MPRNGRTGFTSIELLVVIDGHVKSTGQADAYKAMYPGGVPIKTPSFYP